jgi:hypothetical protein
MVFAADFLFELADFLGKEFDRTPTVGADHMVMAAAVVLVLVAGDAVVEGHFAGQAALCEKFQSAVNRGVADAGIFFLHQAVQSWVERWSRVSRKVCRMTSRCAVCFSPTVFRWR